MSLQRIGVDAELRQKDRNVLDIGEEKECSSPYHLAERAEIRRSMTCAIEKMPAMDQIVLSMSFEERTSVREIAKALNGHESMRGAGKSKGNQSIALPSERQMADSDRRQ